MEIFIEDSYEAMSAKASFAVFKEVNLVDRPLLCPASGDSPAGMYRELSKKIDQQDKSVSNWLFVGLDEWIGMDGSDEGSCRFHLNHQLFNPLKVDESNIAFFNGRASDTAEECARIATFIKVNNGIDVAILGLGMNGHVGMNEPGTSALLHSHVTDIDPVTQQSAQKYFAKETRITKGITLGIADLMAARHVILLVNGIKKAAIVQQVLEGEISEQFPASLLRRHKNLSVYLDSNAASLLQKP